MSKKTAIIVSLIILLIGGGVSAYLLRSRLPFLSQQQYTEKHLAIPDVKSFGTMEFQDLPKELGFIVYENLTVLVMRPAIFTDGRTGYVIGMRLHNAPIQELYQNKILDFSKNHWTLDYRSRSESMATLQAENKTYQVEVRYVLSKEDTNITAVIVKK